MSNEDLVRKLIVDGLGWDGNESELTADYDLIENDVIDSLGIMKLVSLLEAELDVEIPDEQLVPENFVSVRALSEMIAPLNAG